MSYSLIVRAITVSAIATLLTLVQALPAMANPARWSATDCRLSRATGTPTVHGAVHVRNFDDDNQHSYRLKVVFGEQDDELAQESVSVDDVAPNQTKTSYIDTEDVFDAARDVGDGRISCSIIEIKDDQNRIVTWVDGDDRDGGQTDEVRTYTVASGDTLWSISERYYGDGSQWTRIYDANSDEIERIAREHGFSSSDHGHWIFPGTVLTIP